MQKAFREIVHPVYREHWNFMQSFYRWEVIHRNRIALHHPTFLDKPRGGQAETNIYAGRLWSADLYAINLGPGGYLCLVLLEEATPAEIKRLKSRMLMFKHKKPWIRKDSEYYKSKDYEIYKNALRRKERTSAG